MSKETTNIEQRAREYANEKYPTAIDVDTSYSIVAAYNASMQGYKDGYTDCAALFDNTEQLKAKAYWKGVWWAISEAFSHSQQTAEMLIIYSRITHDKCCELMELTQYNNKGLKSLVDALLSPSFNRGNNG